MNTIEIVLIIALVLGVIGSNLALLKYSSKFKLPPNVKQHFEQDPKPKQDPEQIPGEQSKDDEKSQ